MNILIIHEIDWLKKVIYEPHHLAELFSMKGHKVFVIDCREPDAKNLIAGFHTSTITNFNRVYKNASITVIRLPSLLIKGLNRATYFLACHRIIKKIVQKNKIDIIWLYGVASNGIQSVKVAKEFNLPIIQRQLDVSHEFVKIPFLKQLTKKYEKFEKQSLLKKTAQLISTGNIVGWYQGKMEWGPRALGNRSILADPRNASMKDILNEKIKHRESFRPFAPSVLEEYASEYFDIDIPSPYMLMVAKVKKPEIIPAVTHVDGTGRLQTVSNDANPLYYDLINEFFKITGVPVIINTSMNVMGEPIVNTPEQAYQMIVKTDMDCLVLGNNLIFSDH